MSLSGQHSANPPLSPGFPVACLLITNVPAVTWCGSIDGQRRLIGRDPAAQNRIPPEYIQVSRRHAEVWSTPRGFLIRDLGSSGGTRVNGIPLTGGQESDLRLRDRLWLGGLELVCVSLEEATLPVNPGTGLPMSWSDTATWKSPPKTGEFAIVPLLEELTGAEMDIVRWVSRGMTTPDELGKTLFRSPHTVRTQLNSIYRKLEVHSREELLAFLTRIGYGGGGG